MEIMFNFFHKVVRHIIDLLWMRLLQKKIMCSFPKRIYFLFMYLSFFFYFFPRFSFVFPFSKFCYPPMLPFFKKIILFRSSHRRCSVKKVFLKGSQYLQENTCLESLFNEVAGLLDLATNVADFKLLSK